MLTLDDFGIDLAEVQDSPKDAISHVLKLYEDAAKSYRDAGEKSTTGIKAVVAKVKADEPATVNLNNDLVNKLRSLIYEVLLNDPAVSVLLFDSIQELKDGISAFRQEAIKLVTVDDTATDDEDVDTEQLFETVEFLHKALGNFVNFAQMNGLEVRDLPSAIREVNKKSNKVEVKLPRKPNGPDTKEGDSTKGRHAAIYKMHYTLNDEEIPQGISLNRLALFYCSTPSEWINGSELMDLVQKETGDSWGASDWSVEVPGGILKARKVQTN